MAGAFLRLDWDDRALVARMDGIIAFGQHSIADAAPDIGEHLLNSTRARAEREVAPDGTPWIALSERYARRKAKKKPGAPILRYDFHMLGDRLAYQVDGEDLVFGTSAKQGAAHQYGAPTRNIPPRPWLGIDQADGQEIVQILKGRFVAAVPEAG